MDELTRHTDAWLSFTLSTQLKAPIRRQLFDHYACPSALAEAIANGELPDKLQRYCHSTDTRARVDQALEWRSKAPERHLLTLSDPDYPEKLASIASPPPVLYLTGRPDALVAPHVAIVGARKASPAALEIARELAFGLARAGVIVVSGLAIGIDGEAHQGCLNANGRTVAVAATPADITYPKRHRNLAGRITQNGAIITEFPLGTPLQAYCFPQRNRIISGLCLATVIVEAGLPSGTLLTAKHAIEQGREVMVVPGSIRNPLARGCHALIKDGALLIESTDDILSALSLPLGALLPEVTPAPDNTATVIQDPDALLLLQNLGYDPASADDLTSKTGLSAPRVTRALSSLELKGVVKRSLGRYSRCKE